VSVYVDSSALLSTYLDEPAARRSEELLLLDSGWVTARHTWVEVLRNLARWLERGVRPAARAQFELDWSRMRIVELDRRVCEAAAEIAEATGIRSLDALHLGAAQLIGDGDLPILTCDRRQAAAARSLGWTVIGA